jgi:hypothetical protein
LEQILFFVVPLLLRFSGDKRRAKRLKKVAFYPCLVRLATPYSYQAKQFSCPAFFGLIHGFNPPAY